MPRYIAVDYGSKRIGLAVGDADIRLATPLTTVAASGNLTTDAKAVLAHVDDYGADELVVGLPLNMDDTEGPQAKESRRFGEELARQSGKPVHYWDERLSSIEAVERLAPAELTTKKQRARVDRVAAQVILQEFLDAGAPSGRSTDAP